MCALVLDNYRWNWGGTAGSSSALFVAFAYRNSAGQLGYATVNPDQINSILGSTTGKCRDISDFALSFDQCVSKADARDHFCVSPNDKFDYTMPDPAPQTCDASRSMTWISVSIVYTPQSFDEYTTLPRRDGLVQYFGATFKIGFGERDTLTPFT